jgi:hypothetical protein
MSLFPRIFLVFLSLLLTGAVPSRVIGESDLGSFVAEYCLECHNTDQKQAGLDLELWDSADFLKENRRLVELAWKRIATRQMPPPDAARPDEATYRDVESRLAQSLDALAAEQPEIANVERVRRMTRTEYGYAVKDLLGIDVDVNQWIPRDESSDGFDNLTVGELSPLALSRYLTAAEKISRIAIGRARHVAVGVTVRLPPDLTQENHMDGLPLGTRGGLKMSHTFAESGRYRIAVRLTRDRDEMVEGLQESHDLDFLLDGRAVDRLRIDPPQDDDFTQVDSNLGTEVEIVGGGHEVIVTFVSKGESLREIKRQPFDAAYNRHRHPRNQPAIFEVSIVGPLQPESGSKKHSDSIDKKTKQKGSPAAQHHWPLFTRQAIDGLKSNSIDDQVESAETILRPLLRRAYRREVTDQDFVEPMRFVREAIGESINDDDPSDWQDRFDVGIEQAIASILANPHFLFRVEKTSRPCGKPYPISDQELASRLSFFIWSSLPDDRLLDLAHTNRLHQPDVLRDEVRRMLSDEKSLRLVHNFGSQWLRLRNLDAISPDLRMFPDFDENLRRGFQRETELLLQSIIQNDEPITRLIDSPYTFLNERLAKHYAIPSVRGSHFRRVDLPPDSNRGGVLRNGSVLMVTSYATRTAPTIRGQFVLDTFLGTPPPPPPPSVPALKEPDGGSSDLISIRDRLAAHRSDPACSSCHQLMDPIGFALENYDAVGRWRAYDGEIPVDVAGQLPDGRQVTSPADLEASLLARPDRLAAAVAEKLFTFALGRPTTFQDAAAIRNIVRHSGENEYRFSSLIQAIAESQPFQFRAEP